MLMILLIAVVGGGVALFAYQNQVFVTVYFWQWSWPGVPLWYPVAAAAGAVVAASLIHMAWSGIRWRLTRRSLAQVQDFHQTVLEGHEDAIDSLRRESERLRDEIARLRRAAV